MLGDTILQYIRNGLTRDSNNGQTISEAYLCTIKQSPIECGVTLNFCSSLFAYYYPMSTSTLVELLGNGDIGSLRYGMVLKSFATKTIVIFEATEQNCSIEVRY